MIKVWESFLFLLLATITLCSQSYMDQNIKTTQQEKSSHLLLSLPPTIVKNISFGYDTILADILWIDFIQYFGEQFKKKWYHNDPSYDFSACPIYARLITTLDPHFEYAYWFIGFAIADEGEDPKQAIEFVKQGADINQHSWKLPYSVAIMELMYNVNIQESTKYIDMAVNASDAPHFLKNLQAVMHSKLNNREKATQLWVDIYKESIRKNDTISLERATRNLIKLGVDPKTIFIEHK